MPKERNSFLKSPKACSGQVPAPQEGVICNVMPKNRGALVSKQMFGEGVQFVFRLEVKFPFILRKVPEK